MLVAGGKPQFYLFVLREARLIKAMTLKFREFRLL